MSGQSKATARDNRLGTFLFFIYNLHDQCIAVTLQQRVKADNRPITRCLSVFMVFSAMLTDAFPDCLQKKTH